MRVNNDLGIFDFDDFAMEMTSTELLLVNGGACGGGFSGGSCGGGGGNAGSDSGGSSSSSSGCGGSSGSDSGGGSSSSSGCGGSFNGESGTSVSYGNCGGGTIPTSNNCGGGYTGSGTSYTSSGCGGGNVPTITDRITTSIEQNLDKKYNKNEDGYMCDNWVQEVLTDAGFDYNDYFAGEAKSKTCEEHINSLKKGTYTTNIPSENGVYVVLMNNGHEYTKKDGSKGVLAPHTGLLVIGDGNPYFYDNSSGNKNGGVDITTGNSTVVSVMNQFGYDSFYYLKVE